MRFFRSEVQPSSFNLQSILFQLALICPHAAVSHYCSEAETLSAVTPTICFEHGAKNTEAFIDVKVHAPLGLLTTLQEYESTQTSGIQKKTFTFHEAEPTSTTKSKCKERLTFSTLQNSFGPATSHLRVTLHANNFKTAVLNLEICDRIVLVRCVFICGKYSWGFPNPAAASNQQQAILRSRFMLIISKQQSPIWRFLATSCSFNAHL